jgi:hypothetical protein
MRRSLEGGCAERAAAVFRLHDLLPKKVGSALDAPENEQPSKILTREGAQLRQMKAWCQNRSPPLVRSVYRADTLRESSVLLQRGSDRPSGELDREQRNTRSRSLAR